MKKQNFAKWNVLHYSWDNLEHFTENWESLPGIHTIHFEDTESTIDIYVNEFVSASSYTAIPIFLSGAISKRGNKRGPFFSGRGISKSLQIPAISISDSSLDQSVDLTLGWYLGAAGERFEENLVRTLKTMQSKLKKEYIFVGGSGGGYASLNLARHFGKHASVLVWNPQTDIFKYSERFTKAYLRQSFGFSHTALAAKDWVEYSKLRTAGKITTSVTTQETLRAPRRVLYLQNSTDNHTTIHLKPLWESTVSSPLTEGINKIDANHIVYVGNFAKGHNPPPSDLIATLLSALMHTNSSVEEILSRTSTIAGAIAQDSLQISDRP